MKVFCISDNIDTQMGMRLAGIDSVVVHERSEIIDQLDELMSQSDIAIILMTTKICSLIPDVVTTYKLTKKKPLLCEIPDRHGNSLIGETIDSYISDAIGIKL